jgi:ABC-2 type transport system ATP-binding protein
MAFHSGVLYQSEEYNPAIFMIFCYKKDILFRKVVIFFSPGVDQKMIEVTHLTKSFGDRKAVDNVSFTVQPGEILGYLGPNGAGKSTTIKMLAGILRPDAGKALIDGRDVAADSGLVKAIIGYVPETGAVYEKLSAMEYLTFIAGVYGIPPKEAKEKAGELLGHFQLTEFVNSRLATFSKGMKQKVALAAALIHSPRVIFLDEPLSGLDANAAILVKELLRRLANEGRTILYSSHILEVVENLCDRVAIIHGGQLAALGTVAEIYARFERSNLEEAFQVATGALDLGEQAKALAGLLGR